MKKLILLCSAAAVVMPAAAIAQSTGSQEAEKEIIVTGTRARGVGGTVVPDIPKTRSVLTQDFIKRQAEGQSILAITSNIPGVNFTNTDPYGAGNGNLRIRGFPGNRIAFLWDGLPLNDTGNYAIFGGQQMSPELIDQVSVNLGTTDVDSPTPSAAGGVISYRTRLPTKDMQLFVKGSAGTLDYRRFFGAVDSGEFTSFGTRAFLAVERQVSDKFKGPGRNSRFQLNGRLYQPIGANGDFISIAAHHNRNRNNQYNSGTASDYNTNKFFDNIATCVRDAPTAGAVDNDNSGSSTNNTQPASCTNYFGLRLNPSNTQNVRGSMKFTLAPNLTFTADPSYFWTVANGGGTALIAENDQRLRDVTGSLGVDLNGDGDILDNNTTGSTSGAGVRVYSPSNTRTKRFTFLSSLIWEPLEGQRLRGAFTYDRGRHRQTAEYGRIDANGDPFNVFGGKYDAGEGIVSAGGNRLQNRNRLSYAILKQFSGEYFGEFFERKLKVTAGIRAPYFTRELNQNCFTSNGTNVFGGAGTTDTARLQNGGFRITAGNPYCTDQANPILPGATLANPLAGNGTRYFAPFERTVKYSPILPSAGASFEFVTGHSVYVSYGKNFSSPSTDSLYRSVVLDPDPETTQNYEGGYRFRSNKVQAQVAGYRVDYKNRIVSAADLDPASPTFGSSIDRNAGDASGWGIDSQISFRPDAVTSFYIYGSYTKTKILENVLRTITCPTGTPTGTVCNAIDVLTKGAEFVETPKWQFGGRAQRDFGPLSLGVQGKYVGKRFSTDDNGRTIVTAVTAGQTVGQPFVLTNIGRVPIAPNGRTNAYTLIDADAILKLDSLGIGGAQFRLSVQNLLNKYYFGNISTQTTLSGGPRYSVGGPRTVQGTLSMTF